MMLNDRQMTAIAAINLSSSILSILGAGSIIVCALCWRKVILAEVFPLFQLSIGDLAASSLLVVSCILELSKVDPYHPGHQSACDYIQGITSSLFVSTFLLTMLYAVEACLRLKKRIRYEPNFHQKLVSHNVMYLLYFLSWVIPCIVAIIVVAVASADDNDFSPIIPSSCSSCLPVFHYNEDSCYLTLIDGNNWHIAQKSLFLTPLLLVTMMIIGLYIYINKLVKKFSRQRGYRNRGLELAVFTKTLQYQIVFIFCWGSSLILGFASFFPSFNMSSFYAVYILQALLGPLQGFLNCIVYGWRRPNFRRSISENTPLSSAINRFRQMSLSRGLTTSPILFADEN